MIPTELHLLSSWVILVGAPRPERIRLSTSIPSAREARWLEERCSCVGLHRAGAPAIHLGIYFPSAGQKRDQAAFVRWASDNDGGRGVYLRSSCRSSSADRSGARPHIKVGDEDPQFACSWGSSASQKASRSTASPSSSSRSATARAAGTAISRRLRRSRSRTPCCSSRSRQQPDTVESRAPLSWRPTVASTLPLSGHVHDSSQETPRFRFGAWRHHGRAYFAAFCRATVRKYP